MAVRVGVGMARIVMLAALVIGHMRLDRISRFEFRGWACYVRSVAFNSRSKVRSNPSSERSTSSLVRVRSLA